MTKGAAVCASQAASLWSAGGNDQPPQRAGLYFQNSVDFGSWEASLREENSPENGKKR